MFSSRHVAAVGYKSKSAGRNFTLSFYSPPLTLQGFIFHGTSLVSLVLSCMLLVLNVGKKACENPQGLGIYLQPQIFICTTHSLE